MSKYLSNLALAASVLALGYSGLASAHCKNFTDPLQPHAQLKLGNIGPVNAGNADVYRFRCFNDGNGNAVSIQYQVLSQVGGDVSAQAVSQGGSAGIIVTDTTSSAGAYFDETPGADCAYTGAGAPSSLATKAVTGNGNQTLVVSRSGTNAGTAREYGVLFHCMGPTVETGTVEIHVGSVGELTGNSTLTPDVDLIIDR